MRIAAVGANSEWANRLINILSGPKSDWANSNHGSSGRGGTGNGSNPVDIVGSFGTFTVGCEMLIS